MIKSVTVSNFRSINTLSELKLGDNTSFIVGKNGSGKSTLISVLYLTKQLASRETVDGVLNKIAPFGYEIFTKGSPTNNCEIELIIRDDNDNGCTYKFTYSIIASNSTSYGIVSECLSRIEPSGHETVIFKRTNDQVKANSKGTNTLEEVPLNISSNELVMSSYSDDEVVKVKNLITSYNILWFDKSSDQSGFKVHTQDRLDNSNLDAMVVNIYNSDRESFNKAVHVIQQLIPEFQAPMVTKISPNAESKEDKSKLLDRYIVFWHEKDITEMEYTITGLSDGNFRIIQLIFALFSSRKSTCLIGEEIENGQHFGRIKTLLEILRVLSVKLNVQLIFTTHSRDLLDNVNPRDVIYCWKDDKGHSQYQYLDDRVDVPGVKDELGREPTARDILDLGMV